MDGAQFLDVDPLGEPGALELLERLIGADRIGAERDHARDLVALCGTLPLAVCASGVRLAARRRWPIARAVAELGDEARRLAALRTGEGDISVNAVFNTSYQALDEEHAAAYRLLGVHPGPDLGAAAAAALIGTDEEHVLINATNVHRRTGAYETALANYRPALAIAMELGDRRTRVDTLIGIGATFQNSDRYGESIIHHERALAISRSISERYEETLALRHLGEALTASGRYRAAVEHLRQAYALSTEIDIPDERARALASLGVALLHVQGGEAARRPWEEAHRLLATLNLPEARDLQARLQSLDHATAPDSTLELIPFSAGCITRTPRRAAPNIIQESCSHLPHARCVRSTEPAPGPWSSHAMPHLGLRGTRVTKLPSGINQA